ncbi:chorismate mutase [Parasphingopyxis sp. CP4]|uniref:chorismate mutase n=1 Tax=Parasphingopyxis sp. CP4 TaxID=2724527 RepID=UPI002102F51E|nr:chorismate mutase [Parasphingopyxis sp. CP4]
MTDVKSVDETVDPADTSTMAEVREGVDAIDRALVTLMARRFGYMDAAARIKPTRDTVRDEERKADVIANVKAYAAELGVPVPLAAALWELLVENSIAYEFIRYDDIRD